MAKGPPSGPTARAKSTTRVKPITRADVARYAGVSSAVVSYVVNNGPRQVAPATAARVREAIDVLGYRPNVNARALRLGRTTMLGLVVPDCSNPFFAEYALEIEQVAADRGIAVLVASSNSDVAQEGRLMADLIGRRVDGLLVSAVAGPHRHRPAVDRADTPATVYIDSALPAAGHQTLGADARGGARLAVSHLLETHDHETVALLIGSGIRSTVDEREVGWQDALRAGGRTYGPVVRSPFTREGGYAGALQLLTGDRPPTAVFTSNDLQAIGLLRAAHELGIRVPEDLAVVSFDDTQEAEYCWPPLTSVRQPLHEMAQAAVRAVLEPPSARGRHQSFAVDLVIRESCGCKNAASLLEPGASEAYGGIKKS